MDVRPDRSNPSYLLYVDGATPRTPSAACEAVRAAAPASVTDDCFPLTVTGKAPERLVRLTFGFGQGWCSTSIPPMATRFSAGVAELG